MAKSTKAAAPVTPEAREYFLTVIRTTAEPVTASQVAKLLVAPHKLTEAKLAPILDEFVASSTLRSFAPKTAKGKPRYWDRDVSVLSRSLILAAIEKKGSQSQTDLRKAAKQLSDAVFQTAFQSLIETNDLFEHPPLPKKKSTFGNRPPSPEPYLRELGSQLAKTVKMLVSARVPAEELRQALVELVEATGVSLKPTSVTSNEQTKVVPAIDLISLMRRIEPAADNGALVAARELRRVANLEKRPFDLAVLDLARRGKLMLHRHDFASGLSPAERHELVTDGAGTYYVGMALRREDR